MPYVSDGVGYARDWQGCDGVLAQIGRSAVLPLTRSHLFFRDILVNKGVDRSEIGVFVVMMGILTEG